jgi:hypothetical protein
MKERLARAKLTLPNGYCGLPLQQSCPQTRPWVGLIGDRGLGGRLAGGMRGRAGGLGRVSGCR